jgi:hypothetical protein
MLAAGRFSYLKVLKVAVVVALAVVALPIAAEAQARGSLQATATVVDTRPSFDALQAARAVLQPAANNTVATVAQVSVERPAGRPGTIVVTIDYSRN